MKKSQSDVTPITQAQVCKGFSKNNKPCRNKFKYDGKFCHKHLNAEVSNNTTIVPGRAKPIYYLFDDKYRSHFIHVISHY